MASKNKPHEIISGLGWAVQFMGPVVDGLRARGMSDEDIHHLGTPEGLDDMDRGIQGFCDAIAGSVITPPEGARIHTLKVRYQRDREWQQAVNAAGPDTQDSYNVRKVGDLYLPTGSGIVEEELVLLNYPNGGWAQAIAWGEEMRLDRTNPRAVFAIGEQHPAFHREVGINPTYAVATTECYFDGHQLACYVWWDDSGRGALLDWLEFFGDADDWFVFRKKNLELSL